MPITTCPTIMVTGGAGFIGSALIRRLISTSAAQVINIDKLTYAASPGSLVSVQHDRRYVFVQADICDGRAVEDALQRYRPGAIIHLAAESHVDRSIDGPAAFIQTNIVGTFTLLEAAARYWRGLEPQDRERFRFLHVSTDEVFGSLSATGRFTEESRYAPNSPYAASKAAADHLARAWRETFDLPVVISNCSNNFGPFQFPEKLVPLMITCAIEGKDLPIYGDGQQVRDWLHVEDHIDGLLMILAQGRVGESYTIGGYGERSNLELVRAICSELDRQRPDSRGPYSRLIRHVQDRPGHDRRYAIDPAKITDELGWRPRRGVEEGLAQTVEWYLTHEPWWRAILQQTYDGARLGIPRPAPSDRASQ